MIDATKEIIRGLEGVLVTTTTMSKVDGVKGVLTYRGYDIHDLAAQSTFEETCWLLFDGELPTAAALRQFTQTLNAERDLPDAVLRVMRQLPHAAHPMAVLETAVCAYGCTDDTANDTSAANLRRIGTRLVAQIATIGAAAWRLSQGQEPIAPDPSLSYAANFLYMLQGTRPTAEAVRIMDIALICHADHGIPASTFSAMVVASSLTDLYSAIAAAIGSLKGPLHGGANEAVLRQLATIGSPDNVPAFVDDAQANKIKIMGIGHRVYKTYDPRAVIFKKLAEACVRSDASLATLYATALRLEAECVARFGDKGLYPNVDYFSGILYRSLGIDPKMFTPIFAIARMPGWVARLLEYLPHNRLFRPKGKYEGHDQRGYVAMTQR